MKATTILLVEDDEGKRKSVNSFLSKSFPTSSIKEAKSFHSGLTFLVNNKVDLVVLDMSMPTFDTSAKEAGGRHQAYAGREILLHLKRRKINVRVVVLTQFDRFVEGEDTSTLSELDEQLRSRFAGIYMGAVYYSPKLEGWKESLLAIVKNEIESSAHAT